MNFFTTIRVCSLAVFLWLLCVNTDAQRRYVVIDMETKIPVRNVVVQCEGSTVANTIWDGSFVLDSLMADSCDATIALSRSGYMTKTLTSKEMTDTLELLPSFNALGEVIVNGKRRSRVSMGKNYTPSFTDGLPDPSKAPVSFDVDIAGSLEKLFSGKRRKRLEETKKRMAEY